jgi:hypothetical protein
VVVYITGKHGTISLFRKSDFLQNVTVFPCADSLVSPTGRSMVVGEQSRDNSYIGRV